MTLGQLIAGTDRTVQVMETIEEFPLESFMAGNVRFRENSCLDLLEDYIRGLEDTIDRYAAKEVHDKGYVTKKRKELATLTGIAQKLRKEKIELWLHVMPYVREYIRNNGEVGMIRVNMPVSANCDRVMNIDFVNNKMMIW